MAGMIRLRREEFDPAKKHFRYALSRLDDLGTLFAKYEIAAQASLPITSNIFAHVRASGARVWRWLRSRNLRAVMMMR